MIKFKNKGKNKREDVDRKSAWGEGKGVWVWSAWRREARGGGGVTQGEGRCSRLALDQRSPALDLTDVYVLRDSGAHDVDLPKRHIYFYLLIKFNEWSRKIIYCE